MSHLPAALLGLAVCNVLVVYVMRRLRARPSEPPRPAGHHG